MACFVLGCLDGIVRDAAGEPILFRHPRFGRVQSCDGHGITLTMVLKGFEAVRREVRAEITRESIACTGCGRVRGQGCECRVEGVGARGGVKL